MNILVTGAFSLSAAERAELEQAGYTVSFQQQEKDPTKDPQLYDAVLCNGLFLYNNIEQFTSLKTVQLTSAGLDRVPLDYIRAHNIALYNAAGVYSVPMAEFAVGGILQLYKQSRFFSENQKRHVWLKNRSLLELSGKTVCIAGTGDVGREIAKRLKAFGCKVTGINRTVRSVEGFDEVLPLGALPETAITADILISALALTESTRGIINKDIFSNLKPGAVFVNVSRGPLADEAALFAWLQSGNAGGAVLDVFETEPLSADSPLWDMGNVILTPHNSFVGEGNHSRLWECARNHLIRKK